MENSSDIVTTDVVLRALLKTETGGSHHSAESREAHPGDWNLRPVWVLRLISQRPWLLVGDVRQNIRTRLM